MMGKRQIEHTPDFKYPCVSVYVGVCVYVSSLSHVQLFAAPWTVACQTPLCMELSKQEY